MYKRRSKDLNLFYGASPIIFERARLLRSSMTEPEKMLWNHLRNRKFMDLKFRRQHPINKWIVDFYCHEIKLVIEVDGPIHKFRKNNDVARQSELERLDLKIFRVTNDAIYANIEEVLQELKKCILE